MLLDRNQRRRKQGKGEVQHITQPKPVERNLDKRVARDCRQRRVIDSGGEGDQKRSIQGYGLNDIGEQLKPVAKVEAC